MTPSSRPGPQLTDMLRRLRARPVSSWSVGEREAAMRAALQRLADLAAEASGDGGGPGPDPEPGTHVEAASAPGSSSGAVAAPGSRAIRRLVPDVGLVALPDQLAVLAADARRAGVPEEVLNEELAVLAAALTIPAR